MHRLKLDMQFIFFINGKSLSNKVKVHMIRMFMSKLYNQVQ